MGGQLWMLAGKDKKRSAFRYFNVFSEDGDAITDRILHPSIILLL